MMGGDRRAGDEALEQRRRSLEGPAADWLEDEVPPLDAGAAGWPTEAAEMVPELSGSAPRDLAGTRETKPQSEKLGPGSREKEASGRRSRAAGAPGAAGLKRERSMDGGRADSGTLAGAGKTPGEMLERAPTHFPPIEENRVSPRSREANIIKGGDPLENPSGLKRAPPLMLPEGSHEKRDLGPTILGPIGDKGQAEEHRERKHVVEDVDSGRGCRPLVVSPPGGSQPPLKRSCFTVTPPGATCNSVPSTVSWSAASPTSPVSPDGDWRSVLQGLPNRNDMDCLFNQKLEAQTQKFKCVVGDEIKPMKEAISALTSKIGSLESEVHKTQAKIGSLEDTANTQQKNITTLAMQMMDLENRERRCNIRFRGIPDNISEDALKSKIGAICNYYLDRPPTDPIELDRYHRVYGRRSNVDNRPRDVLCRFHYFTDKDAVMKGAWAKGPFMMDGTQITLLQDLSAKTLAMRRILKPLIEIVRQKGATYRWGYPFCMNIRYNGRRFSLRNPNQLSEVFGFLGVTPIDVPDWLRVLHEAV